jgi:hypothetical protein
MGRLTTVGSSGPPKVVSTRAEPLSGPHPSAAADTTVATKIANFDPIIRLIAAPGVCLTQQPAVYTVSGRKSVTCWVAPPGQFTSAAIVFRINARTAMHDLFTGGCTVPLPAPGDHVVTGVIVATTGPEKHRSSKRFSRSTSRWPPHQFLRYSSMSCGIVLIASVEPGSLFGGFLANGTQTQWATNDQSQTRRGL